MANGTTQSIDNYTSGNLSGVNLTNLGTIGDQPITINKAVTLESGTPGSPITISSSSVSNVSVSIPDSTTILAPSSWDGTISPPATGTSSGTAPSGFSVGSTVVEVGSPNVVLLFDQPISVILTGVTGPVGYRPSGSSVWVPINNTCGGTYSSPTSPSFPGECFISNGTDTKIYTYHLTSFASLVAVSPPASSNNNSSSGNGGGGGGGGGGAAATTCNDAYAGGAPTLLSAKVSGPNQVTLNWSKAKDPVTHYVISYGLTPGKPLYGNPNVGGRDTTSYTVGSLSGGTTYFFRVRAGNGCNAGTYSNELSATPGGGVVSGPAAGFQAGVLGVKTEAGNVGVGEEKGQVEAVATESSQTSQVSQTPQPQAAQPSPFNIKYVVFGVIILILGFGIFKLLI